MATLHLRNIEKTYESGPQVIKGINLDVADGEFMVFVGPSGCGKSTMLRMIAGLEDITGGDLLIDGKRANDVQPSERGIAMVFQSYALYPHMSVGENMGFALKLAGKPKAEVDAAVGRAAEILQITHLLDRKPKALSGGQRQRVAIGRAIVRKPKVFLFDEPLSNLDAALRVQMRIELSKLHEELGTTMIYVTHDQVEAMTLGSRIAVFNHGVIEQVGRPLDLYQEPANQFVGGFLGSPKMNFIQCAITERRADSIALKVGRASGFELPRSIAADAGSELTLGVRPEHLDLAPAGDGISARVDLLEHLGDTTIVYAAIDGTDQVVTVKAPGSRSGLRAGDAIGLRPHAAACHLFRPDGRAVQVMA
ncbi:ABC transporter ATP-binding protein [Niveibacterium microcysteis]|uniref:Sn-glycerol-3-phosphate ABC transporter ATP-binding protein UgpC n=1 Tax=Niveibacterium microcysteis TaxID=2811415 RepID=A0ABX7M745_9RHOO|nr:sn-glycerol-3-phosphate ABC transporter ATP-binding protein UgpC [Niveibacterium microcysteis]QSI77234.1 sn-glycerol-3-phosphate ABC transporter ATP-binding protein UgpC [Niveibacterium microcysteis]